MMTSAYLFDNNHILRKVDEPQLVHAIDEHFNNVVSIETTADAVPCTERYVIVEDTVNGS